MDDLEKKNIDVFAHSIQNSKIYYLIDNYYLENLGM